MFKRMADLLTDVTHQNYIDEEKRLEKSSFHNRRERSAPKEDRFKTNIACKAVLNWGINPTLQAEVYTCCQTTGRCSHENQVLLD